MLRGTAYRKHKLAYTGSIQTECGRLTTEHNGQFVLNNSIDEEHIDWLICPCDDSTYV